MNFQKITLITSLILTNCLFAQNNLLITEKKETKTTYLDSIKNSFVNHPVAECIDERWTNNFINQDLFNEFTTDLEKINLDKNVDYNLSTELLKERLKVLDSKSAFNIEYNKGLENIIKHYLKNRSKSYERLMALSQYYFPIFEEKLAKYNVPLEIKYLAVVESALNPRAVSKMGATGLWQFMYQTGKQYNLDINTYVDERSNMLKATEAACQYMVNMYKIFGDWDLVLASYNAGPGNVAKAIRRSGGKQNYWNIRPHLPKETQGYVPAFLATMYVFEYHKEHGIIPKKAVVNYFETDTIRVKDKMTFAQISDLLDISVEQLQFLNPSYKRDVIPFMTDKDHYLCLPLNKIAVFTSNEDKIYAYLNYDQSKRELPHFSTNAVASNDSSDEYTKSVSKTKYHKVKRGETLGEISQKYRVSLSTLKSWNRLKSNNIAVGKSLKIITEQTIVVAKKQIQPKEVKTTVVAVDTTALDTKIHVVEKGDYLFNIAKKHGITKEELIAWNSLENENLKIGDKLNLTGESLKEIVKIKTIEYIVQSGDNLGKIAEKYQVDIDDIKKWNSLNDNSIKISQVLKINQEEIIVSNITETKPKKVDNKNFNKSISYYTVRKGDSLYSISQKIKGVTVTDLQKWNGISGKSLKPGMKLKISG